MWMVSNKEKQEVNPNECWQCAIQHGIQSFDVDDGGTGSRTVTHIGQSVLIWVKK